MMMSCVSSGPSADDEKFRVVIIGASFAGLQVAHDLGAQPDVTVTLIDTNAFWEFTPSMHTALCGTEATKKAADLLVPLDGFLTQKNVTFLQAEAVALSSTAVRVSVVSTAEPRDVPYDRLVVATGCSYASPIRPAPTEISRDSRIERIDATRRNIQNATTVLIVGGGAVGVEMAAEILANNRKKTVILATNAKELLLDCPEKVRRKAATWLSSNGARLVFNAKVEEVSKGRYRIGNDETVEASACFWCIGGKPRTAFARGALELDGRGFVSIDPATRASVSNPHIYAVGDVASKSDAQRLASYAHLEGEYVASVILHSLRKKPAPKRYEPPPRMVAISLGPRDGAFVYDSVNVALLPGRLVPWLKTAIELWFIRLLPMPYALLKLLPGDAAARVWSKPTTTKKSSESPVKTTSTSPASL